ncbi:dATP/dGTP pyrophosphohydrolase domain-containing protein [Micromonospora tulbaghiae]|uniref:dATP/dGTP pyrophosphohydrolase domain-containing protein n=1 Tax=Micromonospora tulbaghiae TaxID=479978 RepID=UPI0033E1CE35
MGYLNPHNPTPAVIDAGHLARQRSFSERTFGPGPRTEGVLDHIRKELTEVEASPYDLSEWVDVVILALDGAWRAGHEPQQIIDAIVAKQAKNEARTWPDWRTAAPGQAIEHDRTAEVPS